MPPEIHAQYLLNRRSFLSNTMTGLSSIALAQMLASQNLLWGATDEKVPIRPSGPAISSTGFGTGRLFPRRQRREKGARFAVA